MYTLYGKKGSGSAAITTDRVAMALAQFVRSMVSAESRYDRAFVAAGVANLASTLSAREIDVQEISDGALLITGTVRSGHERGRAVALTEGVKGVKEIHDRLIVDNASRRRRLRVLRREVDESEEE